MGSDHNTIMGMHDTVVSAKSKLYTVNCVDRHARKHPDRVALIWEKDEPGEEERVTYK